MGTTAWQLRHARGKTKVPLKLGRRVHESESASSQRQHTCQDYEISLPSRLCNSHAGIWIRSPEENYVKFLSTSMTNGVLKELEELILKKSVLRGALFHIFVAAKSVVPTYFGTIIVCGGKEVLQQ